MNKYLDEYLGRHLKIIRCPDVSKIGICGKIIFESKNMFEVKDEKGRTLKIPKEETLFEIDSQLIEGTKICLKPAQRIKLVKR